MALLIDRHAEDGGQIAEDLLQATARVDRALGISDDPATAFDVISSRQQMRTLAELAAEGYERPKVPTRDGTMTTPFGEVAIRTYAPESAGPVIALVHGGGWMAGDIDTHDSIARWLATEAAATVVVIDYSLAPEFPFPRAPIEVAAVLTSLGHNLSPGRGLFVVGDSAGANIGAMALLRLSPVERDRISGFVSIYGPYVPSMDLSSHNLYGDGRYGISVARMRWCWGLYAPASIPNTQADVTPLGKDLTGFPPTLCVAAECDVLLDDTLTFYSQLAASQVDVSLSLWPGLSHGCLHYVGAVASVSHAARSIVRFIVSRRPTPGAGAPARMQSGFSHGHGDESAREVLRDVDPLLVRSRSRLHDSVAHKVAMRILSGELKPGQTLTTEESASAAMGVSRAAYREAMRTLAAKGLITSQPKVGTKVAPREDWSILDPDLLAWSFEAEPDEQFIRDLFELRNTVEPTAASIAAGRRDESDLSALSRSLAGMTESAPDTIEWLSTIVDFHHSLLLASKNEALAALWPAIGLTLRWSVKLQMILPALRSTRDSLADHARIFECIASQNSSAAHAAMTKLIEWTFADTIHNLRRVSRATASQAVTDR